VAPIVRPMCRRKLSPVTCSRRGEPTHPFKRVKRAIELAGGQLVRRARPDEVEQDVPTVSYRARITLGGSPFKVETTRSSASRTWKPSIGLNESSDDGRLANQISSTRQLIEGRHQVRPHTFCFDARDGTLSELLLIRVRIATQNRK
jgi:hypothetical protein